MGQASFLSPPSSEAPKAFKPEHEDIRATERLVQGEIQALETERHRMRTIKIQRDSQTRDRVTETDRETKSDTGRPLRKRETRSGRDSG